MMEAFAFSYVIEILLQFHCTSGSNYVRLEEMKEMSSVKVWVSMLFKKGEDFLQWFFTFIFISKQQIIAWLWVKSLIPEDAGLTLSPMCLSFTVHIKERKKKNPLSCTISTHIYNIWPPFSFFCSRYTDKKEKKSLQCHTILAEGRILSNDYPTVWFFRMSARQRQVVRGTVILHHCQREPKIHIVMTKVTETHIFNYTLSQSFLCVS